MGGWDITSPPWQLLNPEGPENRKQNRHPTRVAFPIFRQIRVQMPAPEAPASISKACSSWKDVNQRFHEKVTWLAGFFRSQPREPSFFFAEVSVYINEFGSLSAYFNWTLEVVILESGIHASIYQGSQLHPKSESVKNLIATNGQLCSLCM
jgi:hypothetical protein